MKRGKLEYAKEILSKVSFDVQLFRKELAKAFQYLLEHEVEELICWVKANFGEQYCLKPIYIKK